MMRFIYLLLIPLILLGCSEQKPSIKDKDKAHFYTVKKDNLTKTLFFTGKIQPLKETTLIAPIDAVIEAMPHLYGQFVKKDMVVFHLTSNELQKQHNEILTEYLKAKDNYGIAKTKFSGTQELWDAGLISKNNYISEKSSLNTAQISLMQAAERLNDLLDKTGNKDHNITALSFADFEKVKNAFAMKHNSIQIKAPSDGVLLFPPKTGEDFSSRLNTGAAVKSGDVLGLIGDLSGIRIEIVVPEVDIEKVQPGTMAIVRSYAFPEEELKGKVVAVTAQASTNSNSSFPTFSAVIEVNHLTPLQQAHLKVGMSTDIALTVSSENKLVVPLSAVKQEQGRNVVQVVNQDGSKSSRPIITGSTDVDKIIIESGLKENEVIYYG
jgi:HlyD family secretion protein